MSEKGCESIPYNQTASDNMCWQYFHLLLYCPQTPSQSSHSRSIKKCSIYKYKTLLFFLKSKAFYLPFSAISLPFHWFFCILFTSYMFHYNIHISFIKNCISKYYQQILSEAVWLYGIDLYPFSIFFGHPFSYIFYVLNIWLMRFSTLIVFKLYFSDSNVYIMSLPCINPFLE